MTLKRSRAYLIKEAFGRVEKLKDKTNNAAAVKSAMLSRYDARLRDFRVQLDEAEKELARLQATVEPGDA